ncbi:MAG TPA: phospholipase D-like domain-containing protein [Candidatus Thermoplasmatota archaeon]|nr:phospholipase D-like domain-containing protein [Candidatus Thermoplasmatota archaeon]
MPWLAWDGRETYAATRAQPLVDEELWGPLLEAIRGARRRIDLTQLLFEPSFRPLTSSLADEMEAAARRGARVRILVNQNAAIPDSYDELRERFAGTPVEVRAVPMTPNVLHMKVLVADDEAFLVDSPFEQKYADSRSHVFDRAHREHEMPFHSVSLRLAGAVVLRIAQIFDALWEGVPLPAPAARQERTGVQLVWSSPAGMLEAEAAGGVLEAYERALREARRFVYIETQYFTSPRMTEAVAAALAREPRLEVILLLNEHMDVPTYDAWQDRRLRELGWPDHPRLGVFSLWSGRRLASDPAARRIYVHSKVAVVDDEWATIGSANLDSISLHEADEFGVRAPRNVDLNAVFLDAAFAAALRRRLWGEHLADRGVWSAEPPAGGWLAHWRGIAEENYRRWEAGEPDRPARIMPYGSLPMSRREKISSPQRAGS